MFEEPGDEIDDAFRSVMRDLADAAPPEPPVEDIFGPFTYTRGVHDVRSKRWVWVAAAAAAVVAVVGTFAVLAIDDDGSTDTADGGCDLRERASVIATVATDGASVTFDVASDPACSGVEVSVAATPALQGVPIVKKVALDESGAASVSDQLLGSRQAEQPWRVELSSSESGGVVATAGFDVEQFCDLEATADLAATHLPESNGIRIVLMVDPLCEGAKFAFDRDGDLFASSPAGGWNTYVVDEAGRIDITEELASTDSIIAIHAIQAGDGVLAGEIATVTLELGG